MSAQPSGSPPPGFLIPPSPARLPATGSEVQDSVPQDAPYAAVGAVPAERRRWSGKRTAAIASIALALTSGGAIAAAAASPDGIAAPSDQRSGPGFGPNGQSRHFRGGSPGPHQAPGQQPGPGQQQGFGAGQGRSGH